MLVRVISVFGWVALPASKTFVLSFFHRRIFAFRGVPAVHWVRLHAFALAPWAGMPPWRCSRVRIRCADSIKLVKAAK